MPFRVAILSLVLLACLPGVATAAEGWQWPLRGELITAYRNGSDPYAGAQHRGIDIAAETGAEVVAATPGTVRFAGVAGSSGLTVSVRTADGRYDTSYLHLSSTSVREGQRVAGGQRVGAVGTSGRRSATAPHLHFGVREAGSRHAYHDPMDFLPPPPTTPREAPRGAPVPVTVPRPVAVAPKPVRAPGRVRVPGRARVRGRVPAFRPLRVPVARRVRVPAGRRAGRPALVRPAGAPVAVRPLVPTARLRARGSQGARGAEGARVPEAGPRAASLPHPASAHPSPQAAEPRASGSSSGPDLGWALACLGLLAAAACLGRPGGGKSTSARGTLDLRALVRPLLTRSARK